MDAQGQDQIPHGDDPFDTALITKLANELYAESGGAAQWPASLPAGSLPVPTVPTTIAGMPGSVPNAPGVLPTLPTTLQVFPTDKPGNPGLSGGYPLATADVHPPVHAGQTDVPTASPAKPGLPSGAHASDSGDTYPFGEPRCNSEVFGGWKDSSLSETDMFSAASDYYFLRTVDSTARTAHSGSTQRFIQPSFQPSLSTLEVESIRRDFPTLHQRVNGHPLIWLDNAATTQKPRSVIDATSSFYSRDNSNIHRAAHTLAARATELYEGGREKVRQFIGAADTKEIVFVRGTTEAVNLVAQTYGRTHIGRGDEILLTEMEHHANIVPWQMLAEQTGALLRVAPINDTGELILEQFAPLLSPRTKLVAVTQVSNALGTINPVEAISGMAHAQGIPVLVDGAQSAPHLPINVQAMDADFFVFSGHKIFAPTGIGVLYGKAALLEEMPPYQGGGNMIKDVTFEKTAYQGIPQKFEAGTQDIAGVVGLGAAIDYLTRIGMPAIAAYEHELLEYATQALSSVRGLRPIGTASAKASVLSFVMDGIQNEQVAKHLDRHGIAVRSGHHCAQPTVRRFGLEGTVRPSLALYNTREEIDILVRALHNLRRH
jgi:cysteine desulfurase/selenocysteine lyase